MDTTLQRLTDLEGSVTKLEQGLVKVQSGLTSVQGDVAGMDVGINGVPGKAKGLSASGAKKAVNGKGYILAYFVDFSKTLNVDGTSYKVGGNYWLCLPYALLKATENTYKVGADDVVVDIDTSYEITTYTKKPLSVGSSGSYTYYYSLSPIRFNEGFSLTDGNVIYTLDPI